MPFAAGSVRLRVSVNATLDAWEEDGDLVVGLEPADASSRAALAAYRGAIARATGVKHPGTLGGGVNNIMGNADL